MTAGQREKSDLHSTDWLLGAFDAACQKIRGGLESEAVALVYILTAGRNARLQNTSSLTPQLQLS